MSGQQTTVSVSGAWYTGSLQPMLARSRYASMRDRDRRPLLRGTANEWTARAGEAAGSWTSSLMMQGWGRVWYHDRTVLLYSLCGGGDAGGGCFA